jgi:hypothetical protein
MSLMRDAEWAAVAPIITASRPAVRVSKSCFMGRSMSVNLLTLIRAGTLFIVLVLPIIFFPYQFVKPWQSIFLELLANS